MERAVEEQRSILSQMAGARTVRPAGSRAAPAVRAVVLLAVVTLYRLRAASLPYTWTVDLFVAAAAAYVLLSTFAASRRKDEERLTGIAVCMDILFVTAIVWQSGGPGSNYVLLYYLPIMHASMRLHFKQAISCSILAVASYSFVIAAQGLGAPILTSSSAHLAMFGASAVVLALFFGTLAQTLQAQRALSDDLQQALDKLYGMYQVSRAAARPGLLETLMDQVAELTVRRLEAVACYIATTDSSGALQVRTARGAASAGGLLPGFNREMAERCLVRQSAVAERTALEKVNGEPMLACLSLPLATQTSTIGAIQVFAFKSKGFTARDVDWLSAVADEATVAAENARLHAEVRRLSVTDELTGLYHRIEFDRLLGEAVQRLDHRDGRLSLLLLDVDGLDEINRRFGQSAGDDVLLTTADMLRACVRGTDIAARYGEDEFALVLVDADVEGARVVAARLRQAVAEKLFHFPPYPSAYSASICIGVVVCRQGTAAGAHEAVALAQEALRQAQVAGKGQIRFWESGVAAPEGIVPQVRALAERISFGTRPKSRPSSHPEDGPQGHPEGDD